MTDQTTTNEIRPYGPGKFNTVLDAYVYNVSLDGGCDEELGDCNGFGWYGLMRNGRTIFRDHDPLLESLNEAEQNQLTESAGVILSEDSQGFVSVEYFDTKAELETAWAELEKAYAETIEDEDEEEDTPEDEDIYADDPAGPFFYLRKQIAATRAELRAWIDANSYSPNVWWVSDHGNPHLITDIHDATKD